MTATGMFVFESYNKPHLTPLPLNTLNKYQSLCEVTKNYLIEEFIVCRLKIFSEESVPLFGPPLPSPPVFTDHQEFRDFLLVKC